MDNQEKDFLDDVDTDTSVRKPKKQLSEQKLQHLSNIRVKALEKKKQMKEITEKANKLKELESLKEAKKIQKEQLAKKYDEMIEKQKVDEIKEVKPKAEEVKPKTEEIKEVKPIEEVKPIKKKKVIKKIVYQEASSSDSDDADEVVRYDPRSGSYHPLREVVKVKKQSKNKIIHVDKPRPQSQNTNYSYSNLLYESSVDKLKNRMMDERAKHLIMSVMPNYG
jgi:hypothetical protein